MLAVDQPVRVLMLLPVPTERRHVAQLDLDAELLADLARRLLQSLPETDVPGRRGVEPQRKDVLAGCSVLEQDLHAALGRPRNPAEERQMPVAFQVDRAARLRPTGR